MMLTATGTSWWDSTLTLATIVLVVATCVLAWHTAKMAKATRDAATEGARAADAAVRAIDIARASHELDSERYRRRYVDLVSVDIGVDHKAGLISLDVTNRGPMPIDYVGFDVDVDNTPHGTTTILPTVDPGGCHRQRFVALLPAGVDGSLDGSRAHIRGRVTFFDHAGQRWAKWAHDQHAEPIEPGDTPGPRWR